MGINWPELLAWKIMQIRATEPMVEENMKIFSHACKFFAKFLHTQFILVGVPLFPVFPKFEIIGSM